MRTEFLSFAISRTQHPREQVHSDWPVLYNFILASTTNFSYVAGINAKDPYRDIFIFPGLNGIIAGIRIVAAF